MLRSIIAQPGPQTLAATASAVAVALESADWAAGHAANSWCRGHSAESVALRDIPSAMEGSNNPPPQEGLLSHLHLPFPPRFPSASEWPRGPQIESSLPARLCGFAGPDCAVRIKLFPVMLNHCSSPARSVPRSVDAHIRRDLSGPAQQPEWKESLVRLPRPPLSGPVQLANSMKDSLLPLVELGLSIGWSALRAKQMYPAIPLLPTTR